MNAYTTGFMLGLAYAAPIGAQNLFVIDSASQQPLPRAYLTASCVALHDIALAAVCFWGMGLVINTHPFIRVALLAFGAVFLLRLGINSIRSFKSTPIDGPTEFLNSKSLWSIASAAAVLTWCNPQAILDGSLLLGSFRASLPPTDYLLFFFGAASASLSWFVGLTSCIGIAKKFTRPILPYVGFACGLVMLFLSAKMGQSAAELIVEQSQFYLASR